MTSPLPACRVMRATTKRTRASLERGVPIRPPHKFDLTRSKKHHAVNLSACRPPPPAPATLVRLFRAENAQRVACLEKTHAPRNNSGGTIASALGIFEQVWSGGSKIAKKLNNPLLLAPSGAFAKAGGPGGLGYDPIAKCEDGMTKSVTSFRCFFLDLDAGRNNWCPFPPFEAEARRVLLRAIPKDGCPGRARGWKEGYHPSKAGRKRHLEFASLAHAGKVD